MLLCTSHNIKCILSLLPLSPLYAVRCFSLDQSDQDTAGCSLSFLCQYDLPLAPSVYFNDTLLLDFKPSTNNSSVTSPPCANEHCVIPLTNKNIGNLILIILSQPLLGCQHGLHLKIEYLTPIGPGCKVVKYEQVNISGESMSCNGPGACKQFVG